MTAWRRAIDSSAQTARSRSACPTKPSKATVPVLRDRRLRRVNLGSVPGDACDEFSG